MKLAQLDRYCSQWPGVTLDVKWGADRCYSVGGKMFAVTSADDKTVQRISFKVPEDQFLSMTDMPGIVAAPYLARVKWVLLEEPKRYGDAWLLERVREAWQIVGGKLPAKTRKALGIT
jgi:predicted DNA-binding protein (MmcQ/YjbR family)